MILKVSIKNMETPAKPTTEPELNDSLRTLVTGAQAILKEKFLGSYLGGSFAHGGWDKSSDVDFCVVIEDDLSHEEIIKLTGLHTKIYNTGTYWGTHLEGAYFPKDILQNLEDTDTLIWYLDNGCLIFERSAHDNTLVNRSVLREHGVTLSGPPAETWIPVIPVEMLKAEVRKTMMEWGSDILKGVYSLDKRWTQAFTVLMYCRFLHTLATGGVHSKPAGVIWAKATLDPKWFTLIDDAVTTRKNQYSNILAPSDPKKVEITKLFIVYILKIHESF